MHLVIEHKTTSEDCSPGSIYWQKLTLDAQISNYLVGARALGFAPDGVLYDVLRKPAIRPYEANSKRAVAETPQEYFVRCAEEILSDPNKYYQRGKVVRLEQEERDAAYDMWQTAEAIRSSRNAERWPRNVDSCAQFNRLCDYWSVCSGQTTVEDGVYFIREQSHVELEGKHHLPLITTSSARAYRACPRRYYYSYELGAKARRKGNALAFGTLIHKGLEAWLLGGLEAALAAVAGPTYGFDDAKAEAMLRGYDARWALSEYETIAVEKEFVAALRNPETGAASRTWLLGGKVDGIVRCKS